jgi:hypothetical protein
MSVKSDLDELRGILADLMLPREAIARIEEEIRAKDYRVEGAWLARRLMELGLRRGKVVEFFRELGVEDESIAYLMERATLGEKKDIEIKIGGGERRGDIRERLRVFRDEKAEAGEEYEDALRSLFHATRGGGKES